MVMSAATTAEEYLAELPEDRRAVVMALRGFVRKHLPKGFRETVSFGMLAYGVPLERYPDTDNGQPLCNVAIAAQKNYFSLYLMGVYQDPAQAAALRDAFKADGKKADIGKSCVRLKAVDDLPLDAIGQLIAGTSVDDFIARYEASRVRKKLASGSGGSRLAESRSAFDSAQ
ncbi:MAG: DUF1801 domain-containing protein, partial [Acidobacteria bacterium]